MWIASTTCGKVTVASAIVVRLVVAEHVAHRPAHLADRAAVLQRLAQHRQHVVGPAGALADLLQARCHHARRRGPSLNAFSRATCSRSDSGSTRRMSGTSGVSSTNLLTPDDDVLLDAVALVVAEGRLLDLVLDEVDRLHRAAQLVDLVDELLGAALDLVGERLDEVGAGERVDGVGGARLVADDLLGAQRDLGRALGGQRQRLVKAVGVQGLGAAAHGGEPLQRDAHDVVLRLLRGQRHAAGLGVEAQPPGPLVLGAEALAHDLAPTSGGRRGTWPPPERRCCGR